MWGEQRKRTFLIVWKGQDRTTICSELHFSDLDSATNGLFDIFDITDKIPLKYVEGYPQWIEVEEG